MKKRYYLVALLFLAYFMIRIFYASQTQYFSNDESYFGLRQAANIAQTGKPLLSDGNRPYYFMPFYYYLLAIPVAFSKDILLLKIINNLFASSIIIASFLLCNRITKNFRISLLCSVLAASIPAYIGETMNNLSSFSIFIPGSLFLVYLFMDLEYNIDFIVPLTLILVLTSSLSLALIVGLSLFLLISFVENIKSRIIDFEYISFFGFFYIWANFVIFKYAIIAKGLSVILFSPNTFSSATLMLAITSIGLLPFLGGTFIVFNYLFKRKSQSVLLLVSLLLSTIALFLMGLLPANLAMILAGEIMVVLFSQFVKDILASIKKTKFSAWHNGAAIFLILVTFITQVIPGTVMTRQSINSAPDRPYVSAFQWLENNSAKRSVVLAAPPEGEFVRYFADRKPAYDPRDIISSNQITQDEIKTVYTGMFLIDTVRIIDKYNITYIVLSKYAKDIYGTGEFNHPECLRLVYNETVKIYEKGDCSIRKL